MHVVKEYEIRKNEFLDTAMALFMQQGYEQTSINAIIQAVGVSKGAFYHYFRTKEDLLDELAARTSEAALQQITPLLHEPGLNAVERMNELFRRTNSFKAQNRELMRTIAKVFYSDSNLLLRRRLSDRSIDMVAPLLAEIISLGVQEGSMHVEHPLDIARLVLRMGSDLVSDFAREFQREVQEGPSDVQLNNNPIIRQLEVYSSCMERILGLQPGVLKIIDDSLLSLLKEEQHD